MTHSNDRLDRIIDAKVTEKTFNGNKPAKLYDKDFVAWADQQALLLEQERWDELDLLNLIEEVRDLGRQERNAIESQLTRLFLHLLKWQYQPKNRGSSWEVSIRDSRKQIRRLVKKYPVLSKHIRNQNVFYECYSNAREDAADETGLPINTFPLDYPFNLEQALEQDFLPGTTDANGDEPRPPR